MKKFALVVLAAGFAITAAACSSSPSKPAAQPTTTTTTASVDANHDGLVDGAYSLTDYCVSTAAGGAIAQGVAVNRDVVAAKCAEVVKAGTVKNTDDVDTAIAAVDWRSLAR